MREISRVRARPQVAEQSLKAVKAAASKRSVAVAVNSFFFTC